MTLIKYEQLDMMLQTRGESSSQLYIGSIIK